MSESDAIIDFARTAIAVLDADSLIEIFKNLPPKDTLAMCNSGAIGDFCEDPALWTILMKAHFSDFDLTDDPRAQYNALATGVVTTYNVAGAEGELFGDAILGYPTNEEAEGHPLIKVKIRGLPLTNGSTKWVAYTWTRTVGRFSSDGEEFIEVFNTEDQAITGALDSFYEVFLDELRYYADAEIGPVNNATVNQAAEELELPAPVNREVWARELKHGDIILRYGDDSVGISVVQLTFRN